MELIPKIGKLWNTLANSRFWLTFQWSLWSECKHSIITTRDLEGLYFIATLIFSIRITSILPETVKTAEVTDSKSSNNRFQNFIKGKMQQKPKGSQDSKMSNIKIKKKKSQSDRLLNILNINSRMAKSSEFQNVLRQR